MATQTIHPTVRGEVLGLLERTPSFHQLDAPTRHALGDSMARIAEYLAAGADAPYAAQLAGNDLASRLTPPPGGSQQPETTAPVQPAAPAAATPAPSASAQTTTGRAGEVTRA